MSTHIDGKGADRFNINIDYISLDLFKGSYKGNNPRLTNFYQEATFITKQG